MKKILSLLLAGAMLFSLTACGEKQPATEGEAPKTEQTKLVLGLDDSFPPMGFRDENNEMVGFDIDLANAV
ncbi:MAG: transporter substrate-binding domain-containing protein, partial [Oscillospiraceae bacterium]